MGETPSTEEKFLKLIRNEKKSLASGGTVAKEMQFNNSIERVKKIDRKEILSGDYLASGTRILAVICLLLLGFVVYKYYALNNSQTDMSYDVASKRGARNSKVLLPQEQLVKNFSAYRRGIRQKKLFGTFDDVGDVTTTSRVVDRPGQSGNDLINLKLVGITLGQDPMAIFEDMKKNETLFMSNGDEVYNAVIKDILEDRVLFDFQGETVEIYP